MMMKDAVDLVDLPMKISVIMYNIGSAVSDRIRKQFGIGIVHVYRCIVRMPPHAVFKIQRIDSAFFLCYKEKRSAETVTQGAESVCRAHEIRQRSVGSK